MLELKKWEGTRFIRIGLVEVVYEVGYVGKFRCS